jgi:uncharacterized repeat protein (TIGR02543 family)
MKKCFKISMIVTIVAIIGLVLAGCNEPNSVIDIAAIQGISVPVIGGIPVTKITENAQYSGTVTWNGNPSTFAAATVYTATITLTAKNGYTFQGVGADFFTVAGATSVKNKANSGVITAVFSGSSAINIAAIQGVTKPVTGGTPVTSITENAQYSGTVTWNGNPSTFAAATGYTATITLTAKSGYTLQGVGANFFTVAGTTSVTNNANSGVITAVFPSTLTANIYTAAIQGVTIPAIGGTPVSSITANNQYRGTVTWSPNHSTFDASTIYTATITLTAQTGYTLQGIGANFFTVAGTTSVTNNANSGVITATFPQTQAKVPVDRIEYYWVDQHGNLATTSGGEVYVAAGNTLTITAQGANYNVKQWYLNGVNTGQNGNTYNFSSATTGIGKHTVSLAVEKNGKVYNTNITIRVGIIVVTYNINGGTGTVPASQTVIAGSSISLPDGSGFSRTGYTFGGWAINASGTGTHYNAGSSYTPINDITLYAVWNSSCTVRFNLNNATSGSTPNSQTVTAGSSIILPDGSGFSRTGYTFGGWITSASGTGTHYNAGSSYTPTSNITLYARWTKQEWYTMYMYDSGLGRKNCAIRFYINDYYFTQIPDDNNLFSFTGPVGFTLHVATGDVVKLYWVAGNKPSEEAAFIMYKQGTQPSPAFNPTSWSGSNALVYKLYSSDKNDGALLGSFTVQ